MKTNFLLSLLLACSLTAGAQTVGEWLALTPVRIEKPALSQFKNVDNQVFTENLFLEYMSINIHDLIPDADRPENRFRDLQWSKARMQADTVLAATAGQKPELNYYAVYLSNDQWTQGEFTFKFFGSAEVYIDGKKKLTYTDKKPAHRSIFCELIPGKHRIIIKTVTYGGKVFSASFSPTLPKDGKNVVFSLSPRHGLDIYDILNGNRITGASLSPSGKYVLLRSRENIDGKGFTNTLVYRVSDKEVIYAFATGLSPQWIPGKDQISYLQKEGKGNSLYSYDPEKKEIRCLIKEDPEIQNYTWSPDRSYLIYSSGKNYGESNWQLRKLNGIEDRQPYYRYRSSLCKYDFATGLHSRLTWGNLSASLMDISPDGSQILFSTSRPDYNEFPYTKQNIYLMNMHTLKTDTLWKNRLFSISCSFSPNGKQLLVSGGPSAFGKIGENIGKNPIVNQYDSQLYIYDLQSRQVNPITRDFNPSVNNYVWHKNGNIYFTAADADYVRLFAYHTTDGKISRIECPGDIIQQISIPENSLQMMYLGSDVSYPPVLYTLDLNDQKASLWENPVKQQFENIEFGEVKDWKYSYKKGTLIDGRFYLPPHFDPNKKYPLIVHYYGGTTPVDRSFGGRYPCNLYAANGYVVYVLQPSGTIGYGQEFSARHQNNWGKITGDEIISATKAFIKAHPFIDAEKVGCIGASYGGFTTMYLTTHSDIFACAISHAGISSLDGYWGDGYWGYTYSTNATAYAFPWNRKDIYVDQSPLYSADKAHNPILLIHGTKDTNVPTAQSMQFYTALKLLGKDVEMVFVKDADHHVLDYQQRILWNNTILAYFDKYLKDQPAWWENLYKDKNF